MPPTGVSANNLARMQGNAQGLMPDFCVFYSKIYIADGVGGTNLDPGPIWSGQCRIDPFRNPQNETEAMRTATITDEIITAPVSAPLAENIRILSNGQYYEVVKVVNSQSWPAYKQAQISRVSPPK